MMRRYRGKAFRWRDGGMNPKEDKQSTAGIRAGPSHLTDEGKYKKLFPSLEIVAVSASQSWKGSSGDDMIAVGLFE